MKTTILYFSATGNSLQVAKDIAQSVGDATLVKMTAEAGERIMFDTDAVGIVFPVYAFGMPKLVAKYVKKIRAKGSGQYFFAVANCAGNAGGALPQAARMLAKNGIALQAGFTVFMPGNFLPVYEPHPLEAQQKMFAAWEKQCGEVAAAVTGRKCVAFNSITVKQRLMGRLINPLALSQFNRQDRRFSVEESCNGCGVCRKVCPVGNIQMENEQPVWQHGCEQCMACIHLCPKAAIQAGEATAKRRRYKNPNVSLKELMHR